MNFVEFNYTSKDGEETVALRPSDVIRFFKVDDNHTDIKFRGDKKGKIYAVIVDEPFDLVLEKLNEAVDF